MYFSTSRMGDSVPQPVLEQWEREKETWKRNNPEPRTLRQEWEYRKMFSKKMEEYLDSGRGSCILANKAASEILENALLHFDGLRYCLGAYVVMPNHFHLLAIPKPDFHLSDILHSWKSFTSHAINKALGRTGRLWQDESYDHIVRSDAQRFHYEEYIRQNPLRAGLTSVSFRLGCGSAGQLPIEGEEEWEEE